MQVTIGTEKVSVTVTRKTEGDLLVSQHSFERWFPDKKSARAAIRGMIDVFIDSPENTEESDVS